MLRSGHADAAWFSTAFLSQIPVTKVDGILAQLTSSLGDYGGIEGSHGDFIARFAKGTQEVLVHLDAQNNIDSLLFKPPKLTTSLDDALRALQRSSGTLSYVIIEGRSERAALNASTPLAIGSTFKLAVLAALRDRVARGELHWADVVSLDPQWKSLPSGVMQTWPDELPVTLATYAAQMISISDNPAADALIRIVGPSALAPYAGKNTPFLTTREVFVMKSTPGAARGAAFRAASNTAERVAVLHAVDTMALPRAGEVIAEPLLDLEWHYSVRELCALMDRVADLPLMTINAGVADPGAFRRVAYKGGSDSGVVNLTTHVTTRRGTQICFSATVNDATKPVDESALFSAYGAVLGALASH